MHVGFKIPWKRWHCFQALPTKVCSEAGCFHVTLSAYHSFCVMGHSFQFGTGPDPRVKATGVRWPVWISFLCAFSVIWRVVFGFCFCFCCCLVLCCCHRIVTVLLLRHCDCLPELCYANTTVGFTDAAAKAFATQSNCCN